MKLKRELGAVDGSVDQPRPKRRRRGSSAATPSDVDMEDGSSEGDIAGLAERKIIAEQGMKIWKAVRNAKGKDDRLLSYDFMRLPPRRQYADYYTIIKHPICLEEIKVRLNGYEYRSLEAVKHEFDTCFRNAKKYNMKESQIWRDAKSLHKIATFQYKTLSGTADDVDVMGSDDGSDEDGKVRPGKPPNMYQLMKARMDKLIAKTDDTGRSITDVFMELPSKKEWPSYYKTIKKLMCFNMINKRIRTKNYLNMGEFATDVEQVFTNAMTFNEEHSIIWADAVKLKGSFRELMSDLPPSYALPDYNPSAQSQNGKLKLRVPAPSHAATPSNSTGLKVKLPALASAATAPSAAQASRAPQTQIKQPSQSPSISTKPIPQSQVAQPQQQAAQTTSTYLRPANFSQPNPLQPQPQYQYYSQTASQPQSTTQSISPSPLPPTPTPANVVYDHPLLSITVKTLPLGRTLRLDSSEGVRTWVLPLTKAESTVDVLDVRFEAPESDDEDKDSKNDDTEDEVFVKANGSVIDAKVPNKEEGEGIWEISELKSGTNIVEVGEKDGEIWKIVLQRGAK